MNTRTRAPWLLAAALSLSVGPAAAVAQDPTQGRTGTDPFDLPGPDTPLDELGAETQRQLEEQRRQREEEEAARRERDVLPDSSDDTGVTPAPDDSLGEAPLQP